MAFQYIETFILTWCPTTFSPEEYERILKQMQEHLKDSDTCQGIEKLATYLRGKEVNFKLKNMKKFLRISHSHSYLLKQLLGLNI